MKRSSSAPHWFLDNLSNMLLAVVLAILVWSVAVQQANPNIERTFPAAILIVEQNLPAGMITYGESVRSVRVTLSAPQSAWDVMTADRLTASIDLSGQPTGTLQLDVRVSTADRTVRVTKIEPAAIALKMEPLAEAQAPVAINVVGEPRLGYAPKPVQATPASVIVRGPASLVRQVIDVGGQISIQDARTDVSQTIALAPRDANGQALANISLVPSSTLAVVGMQQLGGFRDLAVKIDLHGAVAPGFLIANVSVKPQIVTVFGSPSTLEAQPGFIETEPVTVSGATTDLDNRVRLNLPSGVSMLGDPTVQVTVKVNPIESSVTVQRPASIQGMLPGFTVTLSPESVDVILSGPIARLEALHSEDVQVILNLFNLSLGTHQVTPAVIAPNGITVASILPATIQVSISEIITPTETITPTRTLTPTPKP
ncbi:MAG TPA: CdaR family protein [Anaerolineae bacterium]|nr:CdaR family protein [Anaerolineae bacterium]